MLRRTRFLMTCFVFTLLGALSASPASAQTGTVTCESRGNDREQCAIDRGARVELSRQVSETPCRRNANWGVGQEYIWVTGGCRAQFLVTAGSAGVTNSSAGATPMQLRACRSEADRRLAAYTYDQVSVQPESRQGSIATVRWSAGNAAGLCTVATTGRIVRFTMNGAGGGYGDVQTLGTTTQLTCESKGTGREECRIPEGARVRLVRQISQSPCRLNDTYGTGQGYLWVAKGCRAEFAVTEVVSAPANAPANAPAVVQAPGENARRSTRVVCESSGNARRQCPIREGANVQLVKRLSSAMCRESESWGTGPGYIWVSRGCGAEFVVR